MMGVINFAHSALFMLGAYVGLVATTRLGSFWLGLLIAPPAIGLLGAAMERWLLRPLRERYRLPFPGYFYRTTTPSRRAVQDDRAVGAVPA
jgi:branched-chain amino acid transport system permease protein